MRCSMYIARSLIINYAFVRLACLINPYFVLKRIITTKQKKKKNIRATNVYIVRTLIEKILAFINPQVKGSAHFCCLHASQCRFFLSFFFSCWILSKQNIYSILMRVNICVFLLLLLHSAWVALSLHLCFSFMSRYKNKII